MTVAKTTKTTAAKAKSADTKEVKVKKPAATAKKAPAAKKPAARTSAKKKTENNQASYEVIQHAAYLIAEKDGFAKDAIAYWFEAELQIKGA